MTKIKISSTFTPSADAVLYQGNILDLLPVIPDQFVKLIVTSPPYNIGKPYESKMELDEYLAQQEIIIRECIRTLKQDGSICWQVGNYVRNGEIIPLDILLYPIFAKYGLKLRNRIIWTFGHGLHTSRRFSGRYEVILWFTKSDSYTFDLDAVRVPQKYPNKKHFKGARKGELSGNPLGKNPADVWEIPNVKANHVEKTIHPCQFPVELVERLVLALTNQGDWVLDPFMGVGSSLIAALIHNRKAAGAELVREYVDVAIDRIHQAEDGQLRIRPMGRPVYEPGKSTNIPPQVINLGTMPQPRLLEQGEDYKLEGNDESGL